MLEDNVMVFLTFRTVIVRHTDTLKLFTQIVVRTSVIAHREPLMYCFINRCMLYYIVKVKFYFSPVEKSPVEWRWYN